MIPDFLIYDEIRRRERERQEDRRERLDLPLYRPDLPRRSPEDDESPADRDEERDRGVTIIDMNDISGSVDDEPSHEDEASEEQDTPEQT